MVHINKHKMTTTKVIVLGYCCVISMGTLLLMLPIANREHSFIPLMDALFTATSATCVTGLVVHDTYSFWSEFGQCVILLLIQIGGIGFMTITITALTLTKMKIGLSKRLLMQESVDAPQVGGIVRMTKFILFGTMLIEGIGAVLLSFWFIPRLGWIKGICFSVFHSISAFCNAGIDLMGIFSPGSSLITAASSPIINITIMFLIAIGGLGFFVWADVKAHGIRFKRYRLHTKIVLTTTGILIVGGALLIFVIEYNGVAMQGMSIGEKILASFFQSVTPRTAGFNTIALDELKGSSQLAMIGLMFIGGSPGSTAGGIKTTTVTILVLCIWTEFRKRKDIECFRRRIDGTILRHAACITMLYGLLIVASSMFIATTDEASIRAVLFEVTSAVGTVGLSLGITASLSTISQAVLVSLMFIGRVGGITILLAFGNRMSSVPSKLPLEKITVG